MTLKGERYELSFLRDIRTKLFDVTNIDQIWRGNSPGEGRVRKRTMVHFVFC